MSDSETSIRPFHAHATIAVSLTALLASGIIFDWTAAALLLLWLVDMVAIAFEALARAGKWFRHNARRMWNMEIATEMFLPGVLVVLAIPVVASFIVPAYAGWTSATAPTFKSFFSDPSFWVQWFTLSLSGTPTLWVGVAILVMMHGATFWMVFIKLRDWEQFDPDTVAKGPVLHLLAMVVLLLTTPFLMSALEGSLGRASLAAPLTFKLGLDLLVITASLRKLNR